jgi:hypothetical protein
LKPNEVDLIIVKTCMVFVMNNKDREVTIVTNSHDEKGHMAIDPYSEEPTRGMKRKIPNRKCTEHFVK